MIPVFCNKITKFRQLNNVNIKNNSMLDFKQHSLFRKMDVDSVLSATFKLYVKNFKILFLYSFIALLFVQAINYYVGLGEVFKNIDPENVQSVLKGLGGKITILMIVSFSVYALLNAFFINFLYKTDIDKNVKHSDIFSETVKKYFLHMLFFIIVSTVMFTIGMVAGVIVFIIGMLAAALYLATILIPGGTILIVEEKNAFETIGRSFQLAHKDFWPALGCVVLYVIIMILISLVITAIVAIPFIFIFIGNFSDTQSFFDIFNPENFEFGVWIIVFNALVSAITFPITAIFSIVLYFKLRYKEEQGKIEITQ